VTAVAGAPPNAAAGMLSLEDARARMLDGVEPLAAEEVALADCLGRVLAEPIASRLTLPPWLNSAMDGFAVRAADVAGASASSPARLRVIGEVAAGQLPAVAVEAGAAVRILTGAPLPDGADAVVPIEETDAAAGDPTLPDSVAVFAAATVGAHVRAAGSDLRGGDELLAAGTQLGATRLALAAAGGLAVLPVRRCPRVAVISTGDELAPVGDEPGAGQIPDSNSVGLVGQAREAGAEARSLGIAADRLDEMLAMLSEALAWADVVVVSGGVSVGARDVVKEAFAQVGRLELWRVAVQPGKPLAFGIAQRDGRRVLLFGLPGNPVSSFVTFELFVRPVLRRLLGLVDLSGRQLVRARLTEPVTKSVGRRAFLRVRLATARDGTWQASLAGGQGSHVLSALARANGLAIVPEGVDSLPAGSEVEAIVLAAPGAD
jgi:molybdopterin molybdotransferase